MSFHKQAGFSLVELMIAMVLGTLVVLAATGLFMANQKTFSLQHGLLDVQQQGGFTQGFLASRIRYAGFTVSGASTRAGVMLHNKSGIAGVANGTDGGNDRLTFSFDGSQDCEGSYVDASDHSKTTRIIESYWVANQKLKCHGSLTTGDGTVLLHGVVSFQVLYGMDTTKDNRARVSRYVTADKVASVTISNLSSPDNQAQVVAIQVAYLLQHSSDADTSPENTITYKLLDETLTYNPDNPTPPLNKKNAIRRMFISTIPVRNYDPERI